MWAVDEIMWLLRDGKWHDLGEVMKKCSLNQSKAEIVVNFLSESGFIELDKEGRAKLNPLVVEFINEIRRIREVEEVTHRCTGLGA